MTLGLKFCTCEFNIFMAFINIIREIINHQWLPKWPIIQWFSWTSLAPLEKADLAVQGQVPLLHLPKEFLWMEAAGDSGASTSTKLSIFIATFTLPSLWRPSSSRGMMLHGTLPHPQLHHLQGRAQGAFLYTLFVLIDIKQGLVEAVQIRGCQPTIRKGDLYHFPIFFILKHNKVKWHPAFPVPWCRLWSLRGLECGSIVWHKEQGEGGRIKFPESCNCFYLQTP